MLTQRQTKKRARRALVFLAGLHFRNRFDVDPNPPEVWTWTTRRMLTRDMVSLAGPIRVPRSLRRYLKGGP